MHNVSGTRVGLLARVVCIFLMSSSHLHIDTAEYSSNATRCAATVIAVAAIGGIDTRALARQRAHIKPIRLKYARLSSHQLPNRIKTAAIMRRNGRPLAQTNWIICHAAPAP